MSPASATLHVPDRERHADLVPPMIVVVDRQSSTVSLLRESFKEASCPVSFTHFKDPQHAQLFLTETTRRRLRVADAILIEPGLVETDHLVLDAIVRDAGMPIVAFSLDGCGPFTSRRSEPPLAPISYVNTPRRLSDWEGLVVHLLSLIAAARDG